METTEKTRISVQAKINAPIEAVWKYWTSPEDIVKWNNASDAWHTPYAENDLRNGGKFRSRMEARDGSSGFDFEGEYKNIIDRELIEYTIADGRIVKVVFSAEGRKTKIIETFEAENTNPIEMQRAGWQSILDNFKRYAEAKHQ